MILAIDIGNTNIVLGCIDEEKVCFIERISSDKTKMELEYAVDIKMVLDIHGIRRENVEGTIISSVVPQLTKILKAASEKIIKKEPIIVGPGVKNGMNILIENPGQMGSDLVADAVAAIAGYSVPLVIFDLGTATTVCVVDEKKNYIGGMIYPGVNTSLDALAKSASQLNDISIEEPKKLIGRSTTECMKSGLIYSNAAAIDGIIERIEEEMGQSVTAVATGGLAGVIIPYCGKKVILDENLLMKGLWIIYKKNK